MATEPHRASVEELLTGIIGDVRDLLGGHMAAVQGDVKESLSDLKSVLIIVATGVACGVVGTLLVFLAVAATLVAVGLPVWAAMWSVAAIAAALTAVLVRRARTTVRTSDLTPDESITRAAKDAKWVAGRAADTVT